MSLTWSGFAKSETDVTLMQSFTIPGAIPVIMERSGWSIWAFTDLDWHLLRGLASALRSRRVDVDCLAVDEEALLAECRWAEEPPAAVV